MDPEEMEVEFQLIGPETVKLWSPHNDLEVRRTDYRKFFPIKVHCMYSCNVLLFNIGVSGSEEYGGHHVPLYYTSP